MKKLVISSLICLLFLSCSVSPNTQNQEPFSTSLVTRHSSPVPDTSSPLPFTLHPSLIKNNFSDLEKEYKSFSTQALSDAYVSRMFNKFLTTSPNPTQVIRQLEFARYLKDVKSEPSYFNSLKTFIGGDIAKFNLINNTAGVSQKKSTESATFGVFVDSLNPNTNNIVASGLVLNLDAGNASSYSGSGTLWTDLTLNNNNGTLLNGVVFSSSLPKSFSFDGVNDKVTIPASSSFSFNTGNLTIEVWYSRISRKCAYPRIWQFGDNWNTNKNWALDDGHNTFDPTTLTLHVYNYSGNSSFLLKSVTQIQNNQWYHIVITRNGSTWKMYLNNTLESSATWTGAVDSGTTNNMYIGGLGYNSGGSTPDDFVNGKIPVVRIYKGVALSDSEITQNFNSVKSRYGF